jgi:hypothetical protein
LRRKIERETGNVKDRQNDPILNLHIWALDWVGGGWLVAIGGDGSDVKTGLSFVRSFHPHFMARNISSMSNEM